MKWIRLERMGEVFKGYVSSNGISWKLVFQLTNPMPAKSLIGITAESYYFLSLATIKFDNVTVGTLPKSEESEPETIVTTSSDLRVHLFPNPTNEEVNILLSGNQSEVQMTLFTLEGKVVKTATLTCEETKLDISSLQPGMYLARFVSEAGTVTERLVVD
jgi:hypothetical protein